MFRLLVLFVMPWLLCHVLGLKLVSPAQLAGKKTDTPIYNRFVGSQAKSLNITAPLFYTRISEACSLSTEQVHGRIVVLDRKSLSEGKFWSLLHALDCVEDAGAVAAIRIQPDTKYPGGPYNYNYGIGHRNVIPLLCVSANGLSEAIEAVKTGFEVVAELEVDKAVWIELTKTVTFKVFWYAIIPLFNIAVCILACVGLVIHVRKQFREHPPPRMHFAMVMMVGCAIQFLGGVVRLVYCYLCPMYSNPNVHILIANTLLMLTPLSNMLGNISAAVLLLRWGVFGQPAHRKLIERVLFLLGLVTFGGTIYLSFVTIQYVMPFILTVSSLMFLFIVDIVSSLVFMFQGNAFVRVLRRVSVVGGNLPHHRALFRLRALRWVQVAAIIQLVHVVFTVVLLVFITHPVWFLVVVTAHMILLTLGSISHVLAFTPELHVNIILKKKPSIGEITHQDKDTSTITCQLGDKTCPSACVVWTK